MKRGSEMSLKVADGLLRVDSFVEILVAIMAFDFHGASAGNEIELVLWKPISRSLGACSEPRVFRELEVVSTILC
jgi:hypothetical protein